MGLYGMYEKAATAFGNRRELEATADQGQTSDGHVAACIGGILVESAVHDQLGAALPAETDLLAPGTRGLATEAATQQNQAGTYFYTR